MKLGYSVLLSDVEIITLRNPFDDLVRDCDVESMSDGYVRRNRVLHSISLTILLTRNSRSIAQSLVPFLIRQV